MKLIATYIKTIMLVSGLITCTMLAAAFAPGWTLDMMFGKSAVDPLSNIIVRNWGVLVGLVGVTLIYGAFNPYIRRPVLVFASISKTAFIGLILVFGSEYFSRIAPTIAFDAIVVILFVMYLIGHRDAHDAT